jgi:hypothetical protein
MRNAAEFWAEMVGQHSAPGPAAGDVIRLVEKAEGCDFRAAAERLGGQRAVDPDQAKALVEGSRQSGWPGKRPQPDSAKPNASGSAAASTAAPAPVPDKDVAVDVEIEAE